jgi:hypothetical protein
LVSLCLIVAFSCCFEFFILFLVCFVHAHAMDTVSSSSSIDSEDSDLDVDVYTAEDPENVLFAQYCENTQQTLGQCLGEGTKQNYKRLQGYLLCWLYSHQRTRKCFNSEFIAFAEAS